MHWSGMLLNRLCSATQEENQCTMLLKRLCAMQRL